MPFMNNLEIKNNARNRVKEHYMYLLANYPERSILGVFLYGSQNYNLATENSDVDTKAIYIPPFFIFYIYYIINFYKNKINFYLLNTKFENVEFLKLN